ncbi:hypothetical protein ADIS_2781 [Lunatimonas lonarensis]|uniref:SPOR domain-containing protein n=1 Tax=Lunatimonas lonarensis TaxID=1232681 RepID=R7ZRL6_9BACT|nr:SPOR domain-containing protein [Lunatimonas lonarensis]EON76722.1 hypothetical protein ADIS_2781 [Lunatimonas lonarensis]
MSDNKPSNPQDSTPEDDDFGLPTGSFQPLAAHDDPKEEEHDADPSAVAPIVIEESEAVAVPEGGGSTEEKTSTGSTRVLVLILLLITGLGAVGYFLGYFGAKDDRPSPVVEEVREDEPVNPEEIDEAGIAVVDQSGADVLDTELKLVEITSKGSSPRYFVVVGSFIDDDLARDYAKKLNQSGLKTYLIHPYGDIDFFRLAVEEHANVTEALTVIEQVQADFEENLWVLKY